MTKGTRSTGLPKGIRQNSDGRYRATCGRSPDRRQYTFDDLAAAISWKTASDEMWARFGTTLSIEEWRGLDGMAGGDAAVPAARRLKPIKVQEFLDEASEIFQARAKNGAQTRSHMAVLRRFLDEQRILDGYVEDVRASVADTLPEWVHAGGYATSTQGQILSFSSRVWALAVRREHTDINPFEGLRRVNRPPTSTDRHGKQRVKGAEPWDEATLRAIAGLLKVTYRVPFWLLVTTGLRSSELAGLTVEDWNSDKKELSITKQRTGSPAQGVTTLKTEDAARVLPVGPTVAAMIDDYISSLPDRGADRSAWLIRGAHDSGIAHEALRDNIRNACELLEITPEVEGAFKPLHHLRATLGAHLGVMRVSGNAVSRYLGHKAGHGGDPTAAAVTRKHYQPAFTKSVEDVGAAIDAWLQEEFIPYFPEGLAVRGEVDDPITLARAAELLSSEPGDQPVTEANIKALVRVGELVGQTYYPPSAPSHRSLVVSELAVRNLMAARHSESQASYSQVHVAKLLGLDYPVVTHLAQVGELTRLPGNARTRVSARGRYAGNLTGGGIRYAKAEVDAYAKEHAADIERRKTWLKLTEAAELLECSTDTVRRLADAGTLESWREPLGTHRVRHIAPESLKRYQATHATVTEAKAAEMLGCPRARVRALVKTGELDGTLLPTKVKLHSIKTYLARKAKAA